MSWFEACSKYKEKHGKWVVAKPGTPEHAEILKIYNELRTPIVVPSEPTPVNVVTPLVAISETVSMIPLIERPKGPTCEELELERCRKLAEVEAKAAEECRIAKESYDRYVKQMAEHEEQERIKVSIRLNAPKRAAGNVGRRRCKKTDEMVKCRRVDTPKIISFD